MSSAKPHHLARSQLTTLSGTDKRLAALKSRDKDNRAAMHKLNEYEERTAGAECN
jgi:hypothetical protein